MKKIFVPFALILFVLLFLFNQDANAAAQMKWKIGHNRPINDTVQKNLEIFSKEVLEGTDGRIKVDIFPAGQLGAGDAVFEKVAMGSVEMLCAWMTPFLDEKLEVYFFPGYANNYENIAKMYSSGSPFMDILSERCEKLGIKILGSYVQYLAGCAFIEELEDVLNPYAKHKQKVRILSSRTHAYIWEGLGYIITPITYAEILPAMQTGVIDGAATIGAETTYILLRDTAKVFLPANTNLEAWFIFLNLDIWNSLSKEDQKVLSDAAKKIEEKRFVDAPKEMAYWENELTKKGIKVISMTEEQREAFQKRIREYVIPRLSKDLGEEYINRVVKAIEASLESKVN
jgi:TRAP-type C4-dicarboxylate transport system substrate-binding protein